MAHTRRKFGARLISEIIGTPETVFADAELLPGSPPLQDEEQAEAAAAVNRELTVKQASESISDITSFRELISCKSSLL